MNFNFVLLIYGIINPANGMIAFIIQLLRYGLKVKSIYVKIYSVVANSTRCKNQLARHKQIQEL